MTKILPFGGITAKKASTPTTNRTTLYTERNKNQIKINIIESELQEIEQYQQKGAMIRSRTELIENEEKTMKFVFAAEKQNQSKKTLLKNKNGEIKTEEQEMLKIAKKILF